MKSSNLKGFCSVCDHVNQVHEEVPCGAHRCRKKIKMCGATLHYVPTATHTNMIGWVVCRPCPEHGRQGKEEDYSSHPVISKDAEGNLYIAQEGAEA
ncbi:hypothetical protein Micbo1qcDRAFT_34831 [Microdochium bolleyi]|uniref:Uncharacterized protein n=1 Tax=Microdochium bolleyi TaxID=196109 RepID=A0A136INW6_9PEZI|nr:hypothetical protein Micbo1qcDRAFT_34831 [Microdochium bolleyi]